MRGKLFSWFVDEFASGTDDVSREEDSSAEIGIAVVVVGKNGV